MSFLLGLLGDHVDFSNGKSSLERQDKAEFPVYGSNGIIGFSDQNNALGHISIIGRVGTYCGSIHFSKQACWVTDNAIKAIAKNAEEARFWHYAMLNCDLHDLRAGSGQPLVNQSALKKVSLPVPPKSDRLDIAAILGALDDKIEVNRKTAATLEEMARALYRSWFVDFDPVWAKLEGRAPVHMDPTTAALFPDSFGDDGLPEGWEMSTIGEVAEIVGGSTPSTKEPRFWEDGSHFWATPKDLSNLRQPVLFNTERMVTDAGLSQIGSGLSPSGTVLLSSRAPIGYVAIAQIPVAVNQGFIALRETDRISGIEAFCWCHENMDAIHMNANGSTFQEISKKSFRPLPYVLAPSAVRNAFNKVTGPIFQRLSAACSEIHTLAALRDSLLPRLMSGELRVCETREQIEEVA